MGDAEVMAHSSSIAVTPLQVVPKLFAACECYLNMLDKGTTS